MSSKRRAVQQDDDAAPIGPTCLFMLNERANHQYDNLNSLLDLEQRVLALQCEYKQKQTDLMQEFQRTQQQLAVNHFADSQTLLEEFLKERSSASGAGGGAGHSQHPPIKRQSSLPAMSSLSRTSSLEIPASGSPVGTTSSGGHQASTISDRTKEKLKAFIYSKRRRQLSSGDDTRQLYSPYHVKNGNLYQLRKVRSESDLDSRLAGMQSKLAESMAIKGGDAVVVASQPMAAPTLGNLGLTPTCIPLLLQPPAPPQSGDSMNEAAAAALPAFNFMGSPQFFSANPLVGAASPLCAGTNYTALTSHLPLPPVGPFGTYLTVDGGGTFTGEHRTTAPSLCLNSAAVPVNVINGSTMASSLMQPMEQYQYNVLRQQLRDLVLRRKSLVREETDDEVARERLGVQLPSSLASLGGWLAGPNNTDRTTKISGVSFDLAMSKHECVCPMKTLHLEHGERIKAIWSYLQDTGVLNKCKQITGRKAPVEYLRLCHSEWYTTFFGVSSISCLKNDAAAAAIPMRNFVQLPCGGLGVDADTYFNDGPTQLSARIAVGCTVDLCLAVANGVVDNGFAIVRPPGHNAHAEEASAFCFFNNTAIAAKVLRQKIPNMQKIVIVDWDVHHGNGVQKMFEADKNILFISIHRHDNGQFYPYTGAAGDVGVDQGVGYTVNIPFNGVAMGDPEYLAAYRHVVLPILDQFQPDFVIVAAGFDAADGHPNLLGGYHLSPAMFAYMTNALRKYADGRVVLVLEGGFDIPMVSRCVEQCLRALSNQDVEPLRTEVLKHRPNDQAQRVLKQVLQVQQAYWANLDPSVDLNRSQNEMDERIDDV